MGRAGTILILLLGLCPLVYSQGSLRISGVVRDKNGEGILKATLQASCSGDTVETLTKEDGSFVLHIRQGDILSLKITSQGYKIFLQTFKVDSNRQSLFLPPIVLPTEFEDMVPVIVMGIKPVTVLEDTVEYHAGAYNMSPGAELERLMKRLPGIDWDTGGNILVEGKPVKRVLIDGREFMGGDKKTALQNLPVDIIDKVQVIDDYGDKARLTGVKSGESEKVLNIVLKTDKHNGGIAKIESGASNDKYINQLFSDAFLGSKQLTLNGRVNNNSPTGEYYQNLIYLGYNDKLNSKWLVDGGISAGMDKFSTSGSMIQDNYFIGSQIHLEQNTQAKNIQGENSGSFSIKYSPTDNTTLKIYSFLRSNHDRHWLSNISQTSERDSLFTKNVSSDLVNYSQDQKLRSLSDIYFEKVYPNSGNRISLEVISDLSSSHIHQDNQSHSEIQSDTLDNFSYQHNLVNINNSFKQLITKSSYYKPLGKTTLLELGYSYDLTSTRSTQTTQMPDSLHGGLRTIDSLSNDNTFELVIQHIHLGLLTHSSKINITLGLDAQPGSQTGQGFSKGGQPNYHYFNILPTAEASYLFSPGKKINFNYNATSAPPTIQQLNPVEDQTNPQYPVEGNPNLKPAFIQEASLRYEQTSLKSIHYQGFGLGIRYQTTHDMIIPNLVHPQDTSSVIQKTLYTNANGFNTVTLDYRYAFPSILKKRIQITTNGNVTIAHAVVMTDNLLNNSRLINWSEGIQIRLAISNAVESMLSCSYSHSLTKYPSTGSNPIPSSSFDWQWINRYELLKKWTLQYNVSQTLISATAGTLQSNPILANSSLQRDFFRNNQAKISLSVNNLFNSNNGTVQVITPSSITQTRTILSGRYFLLSIVIKLERFR